MSQNGQKNYLTYDISYKEPKTKKFVSLQTRRPAEYFEGLDSSLVKSTGKLRSSKVTRNQQLNVWFQSTVYTFTNSQCVR